MRDDVETYVHTSLICQQDKADHQKKASLLQPLPIPKRPCESVSMDFISVLPKVGDLGSIIVVVDCVSKYATFIAAPKHVTVERTAHLFFKHVVKYWGLSKDIVSDRDSRFTLGTIDAHSTTQPHNSADQQPLPTDVGLLQS
ncbi:UNVERIFIED_CONTAM: hypothetical protein Sangu_1249500 [Sesamum angustifolium]|uniref:Integrase catalytic domain-containing protein n=1 Tax=Sesamum angustifolium TaxID=2727405 RepID=A0AAW2NJW4_9LAMI